MRKTVIRCFFEDFVLIGLITFVIFFSIRLCFLAASGWSNFFGSARTAVQSFLGTADFHAAILDTALDKLTEIGGAGVLFLLNRLRKPTGTEG